MLSSGTTIKNTTPKGNKNKIKIKIYGGFKMSNKNINFAVSGYKYAPESFNGYIIFNKNKTIKLNLTNEEKKFNW